MDKTVALKGVCRAADVIILEIPPLYALVNWSRNAIPVYKGNCVISKLLQIHDILGIL